MRGPHRDEVGLVRVICVKVRGADDFSIPVKKPLCFFVGTVVCTTKATFEEYSSTERVERTPASTRHESSMGLDLCNAQPRRVSERCEP
jgi:hypothetical protein